MAEKAKNVGASYYVKVIIGVCIVWFFGFIPAPAPMTALGMKMIGIFAGTIYLYSVAGLIWPSMMAVVAMGFSGAYENLAATVTAAMGQGTLWQIICLMPICEGISRSGAAKVIVDKMLSIKSLKGHATRINIVMLVAAFVIGILSSTIAAILIAFTIVNSMRDQLGYKRGDGWAAGMTVSAFLAAFLGGSTIPFRGLLAAMVVPVGQVAGTPLNNASYILCTIIIGLIFCALMPVVLKTVLRVDMSKLENFDPADYAEGNKFNRQQGILLAGFAVIMLFFILQIFVPAKSAAGTFINTFGANGIFPVVAIILALIHVDHKPVLDLPVMLKEGVPWGIFLSIAAMLCVAAKFTSKDAGITAWLNGVLGGFVSGMNPVVFVLVILLLTIIITGCMSNYATCVIILTVALPFCPVVGVSTMAMAIGIIFSSCLAALTPGGGAPCPLLFSNENVSDSYGKLYKNLLPMLVTFWILMTVSVFVMGIFI